MGSRQARDRATRLAKSDPAEALRLAREVEEPWFRAQALAHAGRYAPGEQFRAVLAEAKAASFDAPDPYQVVGSSAWWLRALIERRELKSALLEVKDLLPHSLRIPHPVSRLDALFLLFESVFELDPARALVLEALISASQAAKSWKSGARLRAAAIKLAPRHPEEARRVIAAMPDGTYRRTAIQRTAGIVEEAHRPFFC